MKFLSGIDIGLVSKVAGAIALLVLGKYLDRWFTKRPKVLSYIGHVSAFTLRTEDPKTVYTHAVVIVNVGRLHATNVRLGHNVLPDHYQVHPSSIAHHVEQVSGGGGEIVLDRLIPKEQVTISYLYSPPLTWNQINTYTKFDEGFAQIVTVLPTRQYSPWVVRGLKFLIFVGSLTLCVVIVECLLWILAR